MDREAHIWGGFDIPYWHPDRLKDKIPDITRDKRYDLSPGEGRSLAGRFEVSMAATKNQHHNDMGPNQFLSLLSFLFIIVKVIREVLQKLFLSTF